MMRYSESKMKEFVALLEKHTPYIGINQTGIPDFVTYRVTALRDKHALVYQAGVAVLGQGKKHCYVGGKKYDYSAGRYLSLFLPMPIEVEVVEASPEKPLLMAVGLTQEGWEWKENEVGFSYNHPISPA